MKQGDIRLVRFHTSHGVVAAFVKKGRKFLKVVTIDTPISVKKVRVAEERFMTPLMKGDDFYPIRRGRNKFLKAAKTFGITQGAEDIINGAAVPWDDEYVIQEVDQAGVMRARPVAILAEE